jgi:hypothetical protein
LDGQKLAAAAGYATLNNLAGESQAEIDQTQPANTAFCCERHNEHLGWHIPHNAAANTLTHNK